MTNEDSDSSVKGTIDAVTGLVKAIPIYQDTLQPTAKELGKSLETIAKAINVALAPISALVWGYENIEKFISTTVAEKLKNVPAEQICTPSPMLAGPALEALKYTGHENILREMYANLIAAALDSKTTASAHPAFVEVIKQLTPAEAQIIRMLSVEESYPMICQTFKKETSYFDKNQFGRIEQLFSSLCVKKLSITAEDSLIYLDNLRRLQILEIAVSTTQGMSNTILEHLEFDKPIDVRIEQSERLNFTTFGVNFVNACVKDKQ